MSVVVFAVCACIPLALSWTVKMGILIQNGAPHCPEDLRCQQDILLDEDHRFLNISWTRLPAGNLFARAKAVRSLKGDVLIETTPEACRANYLDRHSSVVPQCGIIFHNCTYLLKTRCPIYVRDMQMSPGAIEQYFPQLSVSFTLDDSFLTTLHYILSRENAESYIVVTTSSDDIATISNRFPSKVKKTVSLTVDKSGNFSSKDSLKDIFNAIEEKNLNFIVICSSDCLHNIMVQVVSLKTDISKSTVMKRSRWLLVSTEGGGTEQTLPPDLDHSADVSILHFHSCQQKYPVFSLKKVTNQISNGSKLSKLQAVELTKDAVQRQITSSAPAVADIYTLHDTHGGKVLRLNGRVLPNENRGLSNEIFETDKYGYNNRTFKVGILPWHPFVYKSEDNRTYYGLCLDMLSELARSLNFSYVFVEPVDQEWGRVVDGKWTGLVGDVATGKIDMIIAPLTISDVRETVMDFTQPYFYVHSMIILAKQDPNENQWLTLVAPFRYEVHICILFSLIFSTVFLFVVEEVHPVNAWLDRRLSELRIRYGDILWYHFGALMANGGAYLPKTQSGRSVLACWWLLTVILAATYSGNLIAFLTVTTEKPPFSTLGEMVDQTEFKWGLIGGSAVITLFETSNRSDFQRIWQGVERDTAVDPDVQSLSLDVHLHKVLTEKYAYIGDTTNYDLWLSKACDIYGLSDRFYPMRYGIGFPNNSMNTRIFTEQLLRIHEGGLIQLWYQKWKAANTCEKTSTSAKKVGLLALQSAFYAAGAGLFLAMGILCSEVIMKRTCKGNSCQSPTCVCRLSCQKTSCKDLCSGCFSGNVCGCCSRKTSE
ncbi:glutamate receptor ionotropic, kainate 1-like [Haliotis asinina]|uniref:glutamate receptor ionotropic, kainate 1-like n=1 Tax=Haliotis asinina TaxID=109174 RepID=UPI003531D788